MTEDIQAIEDLLRDLVGTYISHPDELLIDRKEHGGSVYFGITPHGNDAPALVGKQGCHVKALQRILGEIGECAGEIYVLTLREPKIPRDRGNLEKPARPASFDQQRPLALLKRLLVAICLPDTSLEFMWTPSGGSKYTPPSMGFRIYTRSEDDYGKLVATEEGDALVSKPSLVGAIGTLFRAYAAKEGMIFTIEVARS